MSSRIVHKTKYKYVLLFLSIIIVFVVYYYIMYVQDSLKNAEWYKGRCNSELTSVKFQLNVVTEYKNRIDKMLVDAQKTIENDREKMNEVFDNCNSIKQQSIICQNQFEDLQTESKKVKETCEAQSKEFLQMKGDYSMLQQKNEKVQNEVLDLIDKVEALQKDNLRLYNEIRWKAQEQENILDSPMKTYADKSFSKQIEEIGGDYKINIQTAEHEPILKVESK